MENVKEKVKEAVGYLKSITEVSPEFGVILGTGLGMLVHEIEVEHSIAYTDIPHFPVSTVESHKGRLIFGEISGKKAVVMQGRFHYYEGYDMKEVTCPVRVMKQLGIQKLFVSNAAGGLDPDYQLSDLMIIDDHINLFPENPLTGKNIDEYGIRFPDMSEPYATELIKLALEEAEAVGMKIRKGVYAGVSGPNLETKAEYRYLRIIGADAVGMSTVPEVIVARHMDLPVLAVSVITDLCSPGKIEQVTLEKVVAAASKAEPKLALLFKRVMSRL